jgi:N-methylhydantoinase A
VTRPGAGAVRLAKVPTTLPNQAGGVLAAFDAAGADLADLDLIVHGTTTTTNAVLERRLARTGLITTRASATCWNSAAAPARSPTA